MSTSLVSLASLVQAFNPVTPQLRVAAIIVRQNQILLVEHRKRGQRYWVLPGGRLEGRETLDAALRRELKEELDLQARVGPLVIVCESLAPDRHVVNLIFQAEIGEGAAPVLDSRDPVRCRPAGRSRRWRRQSGFSDLSGSERSRARFACSAGTARSGPGLLGRLGLRSDQSWRPRRLPHRPDWLWPGRSPNEKSGSGVPIAACFPP